MNIAELWASIFFGAVGGLISYIPFLIFKIYRLKKQIKRERR